MLAIKLARIGKRKRPFYRIVVSPKHRDTFGDHVEIIGTYDPINEPAKIVVNKDRVLYWLKSGAQPTNTVANILIDEKVIDSLKRRTLPRKREKKQAEMIVQAQAEEPKQVEFDKTPEES